MEYDINFEFNKLIVKKRLEHLLFSVKYNFKMYLFRDYYVYLEYCIVFNRYCG